MTVLAATRWNTNADMMLDVVKLGYAELPERFRAKVEVIQSGCWGWTAATRRYGYGLYRVGSRRDGTRRMVSAHVFSYTHLVGPVPDGLILDHCCHSEAVVKGECGGGSECPHRRCVNPAHLEPVTHLQNQQRRYGGAS